MRLNLENKRLSEVIAATELQFVANTIDAVAYDTRLIVTQRNLVFFALVTNSNNGHKYVQNAYDLGVRNFVVSEPVVLPDDCTILKVENTLFALQELAKFHRNQFSYPVIAITGSYGKTMAKEWLYYLLKDSFTIARSPKSFNSQLGVALSLLQLTEDNDLAFIEAGVSEPGEMARLEEIIDPTFGLFTGIGKSHAENFENEKQQIAEKFKLFKHANFVFADKKYQSPIRRAKLTAEFSNDVDAKLALTSSSPFKETLALCIHLASFLGEEEQILRQKVEELPAVASRLEILDGIHDNLIINDTYSLDLNTLEQALEFQFNQKEKQKRVVIIDVKGLSDDKILEIEMLLEHYALDQKFLIVDDADILNIKHVKNSSILFKGSITSNIKKIVNQFVEKKHETWVEVDLSNVAHNLQIIKKQLKPTTRVLAMLKASSYGAGDVKMGHFLEKKGVNYFGVAYADEGVDLRKNGIKTPIIVMNAEESAFKDIIAFDLEPAIYSIQKLDEFIKELIRSNKNNYPIHLKIETGMHRLGLEREDWKNAVAIINAQPEVSVKSIFSHLSTADAINDNFVHAQATVFNDAKEYFDAFLDTTPFYHILNSSGCFNYPEYQLDMVRIGIGLYGLVDKLKPVVSWYTSISQIKSIKIDDVVGYSKAFIADSNMQIAILPVGYSDGFKRLMSNGVGTVYIDNKSCKIIGNVCMDMCMIDVTGLNCKEGTVVEIIGKNHSLSDLALEMQTISYEVLTSISKRVKRIYIEE